MELSAESSFVMLSGALIGVSLLGMLLPLGASWRMVSAMAQDDWRIRLPVNVAYLFVAALAAWAGGFHFAHTAVDGGYGGQWMVFYPDDSAQMNYSGGFVGDGQFPASSAAWLFYVVACLGVVHLACLSAVASSLQPSLITAVLMSALVFPASFAWTMGDGWLMRAGFVDGAGAGCVHLVTGAAALAWAMLARRDQVSAAPPLAANRRPLFFGGVWLSWIGIIALTLGFGLRQAHAIDMVWMALAAGNLIAASASGAIAVLVIHRWRKKLPAEMGLMAGAVALSADPLSPSLAEAAAMGVAGALAAYALNWWLTRKRIGDAPHHVIAVHLGAGWAACLLACAVNPMAGPKTQLIGAAAVTAGAFSVMLAAGWLHAAIRARFHRAQ